MSRREVLNMLAAYSALIALGYSLVTHNPMPAGVASALLFAIHHVQERNPES